MRIFMFVLMLLLTLSATAAGDSLDYINSERTQPLVRDSVLTGSAQTHAEAMAEAGKIYHSSLPVGEAEIVGRGGSVAGIHEGFMASPSHRATLLGDFTHAGVGSKMGEHGILYVVVIFDERVPATTTTSSTTTTTTAPTTTTTQGVTSTQRVCES